MAVIKEYFGIRLKSIRRATGLTQEALAEMIGINQRPLTRIETGKNMPSFKTVEKLCEALSIEPCELFNFSEFLEKDNSANNDILYKIKQLKAYPQKIKFINLAINALNKDKESLLKMQAIIEGMLLAE